MNSMEPLAVAKQMKQTPLNLNNPRYLHQTPNLSTNIPRQASNLSQNYATITPQLMHDEYDHKMMMMMMMHGGGLYHHHHHHHAPYHHLTNSFPPTMTLGHGPHQPPLLPFPPAISRPPFHSQPPLPLRRTQSLSPPLIVPRKAPVKNKTSPLKKENKKGNNHNGINNNSVQLGSGKVGGNGNKSSKARKRSQLSIGPNPDLTRVMSDVKMDMDGCPISPVFRMAPPPSSLPLPKFTLRKQPPALAPSPMKLMRCKAEAAAIDGTGAATDNICMLLKLR